MNSIKKIIPVYNVGLELGRCNYGIGWLLEDIYELDQFSPLTGLRN